MLEQLKVLVSRHMGGLGDVICTETAVRAARQKHPDAHITWALDGPYFPLFFDQKHAADDILWPDPWDIVLSHLVEASDIWYNLDGPEMRHQLATNYDLTKSRIENWCEYIDCLPDDLCPRWHSHETEREAVISWLGQADIQPFKYVVVQWASADKRKDYVHTGALVKLLGESELPVVVVHHGTLPDLGAFEAINWPLREMGCLIEMAAVAIGPDSMIHHFAAATKTPSVGLFGPTDPTLYLKHYPLASYLWSTKELVAGKACEHTFPCQGIRQRNWWCEQNKDWVPWCLEQITPEEVMETIYNRYNKAVENSFYRSKAISLSKDSSSLFYFQDPRIDLTNLERLQGSKPISQGIRQPISVMRNLCPEL